VLHLGVYTNFVHNEFPPPHTTPGNFQPTLAAFKFLLKNKYVVLRSLYHRKRPALFEFIRTGTDPSISADCNISLIQVLQPFEGLPA
jgi:hypothetical protein